MSNREIAEKRFIYSYRDGYKYVSLKKSAKRWKRPQKKERKASEAFCLGIESSADDFGVGISTFQGEILANKSDSYIPAEGGIHPREAARHHAEVADKVLNEALTTAGLNPKDLSVIAFSQGPGLGPACVQEPPSRGP